MPETFTFEEAQTAESAPFSFQEATPPPAPARDTAFSFEEAKGDWQGTGGKEPPVKELVRPGWRAVPDTINLIMEGLGRAGTGMLNALGPMSQKDPYHRFEYGKPLMNLAEPLTPEETAQMPGPVAGAYNAVAKAANSLTTPEMLMTLPLMGTKLAKPLATVFGAQLAANLPETVQKAAETIGSGGNSFSFEQAQQPEATSAEKWEAGTAAVIQGGMAALALKGGLMPEKPATIAAQLEWLKEGKRAAVLVTPGEAAPEVPEGFEIHPTDAGTFIFDPKKTSVEAINKAIAEDQVGTLLGYGIAKKPQGTSATVTVRDAQGTEKQAVATDRANAASVLEAARRVKDPEDTVSVETAGQVLEDRAAGPSPIVRQQINELTGARARVPAELVEAFNQNAEAPYAMPEGYRRQGNQFVFEAPAEKLTPEQLAARDNAQAMAELRAQKATDAQNEDPDWSVAPEPSERERTERPEAGVPIPVYGERPPDILDWIESNYPDGVKTTSKEDYGTYLDEATGKSRELVSARRGETADKVMGAMHDEGLYRRIDSEDALLEAMNRAAEARKAWRAQQKQGRDAVKDWFDRAIAATEMNGTTLMEGVTGAPIWLTKAAINLALKAARFAYLKTRDLPRAIEEGLKWMRSQNLEGYNEPEGRAWLESNLRNEAALQNTGRTVGAAVQDEVPIVVSSPREYGSRNGSSTVPFLDDAHSAVTGQGWRQRTAGWLDGVMGKTFPKATRLARELGEQGARWISSRMAAKPLADAFTDETLKGLNLDDVEFGAALHEDNLRQLRKETLAEAAEAEKAGDAERAGALRQQAGKVFTFVGEDGIWPDEATYQRYLKQSGVLLAAERHRSLWERYVNPMFREAMKMDPSEKLPSRGEQLQARINLNFVRDGEPVGPDVFTAATPRAALANVLQRRSPFGRLAKGTAAAYRPSYREAMRNTYTRQLEIANRNKFDRMMVERGHAVVAKPGLQLEIGGAPASPFEIRRHIVQTDGRSIPVFQNIYVRRELAGEYRNALNIDAKPAVPVVTAVTRVLNGLALAGLTDVTAHLSNLSHAIINRPGLTRHLWREIGLSLLGRADVPVALVKTFSKLAAGDKARLRELAEIGALREPHAAMPAWNPLSWGSKVIQVADERVRLQLDRMYQNLADQGLVQKSETARREFVNQIGQYSRRAQGSLMRAARDSGLAPFITAGKTFGVLGVRTMALHPGAKATSTPARLALASSMAAKWAGAGILVGTLNYLLTNGKGGGVAGRPGVKYGAIDLGKDDKNGRPLMLNVFGLLGLERAARVTGARGIAEALHNHLPIGVALDSAYRDLVNSWTAPLAGPAVRAGFIAASGHEPAVNVPQIAPQVPPGQSQALQNVKTAAIESNPISAGIHQMMQPGATGWELLQKQMGRFTLQPGKAPEMMRDYPGVVRRAQASAYIDDVIFRARKIEPSQRMDYVLQALDKLDPADRGPAMRRLQERGIIPKGVKLPRTPPR